MHKFIISAVLAASLIIPATASAAPVRECGDFSAYLATGSGGNAVVAENVTTKNVSCNSARTYMKEMWFSGGFPSENGYVMPRSSRTAYYATVRHYKENRIDVRLTRGNKVIRFQAWEDYC